MKVVQGDAISELRIGNEFSDEFNIEIDTHLGLILSLLKFSRW